MNFIADAVIVIVLFAPDNLIVDAFTNLADKHFLHLPGKKRKNEKNDTRNKNENGYCRGGKMVNFMSSEFLFFAFFFFVRSFIQFFLEWTN